MDASGAGVRLAYHVPWQIRIARSPQPRARRDAISAWNLPDQATTNSPVSEAQTGLACRSLAQLPLGLAIAVGMVVVLLAGCSREPGEIVLSLGWAGESEQTVGATPAPPVEVIDIREHASLERTTIGGISMGPIRLDPPAEELVHALVERSLRKVLANPDLQPPPALYCGIRRFEIVTPATAVYWDIIARIELVFRAAGREDVVAAEASERTYVWPTAELLETVARRALDDIESKTPEAMTRLLTGA